VKTVAVDFDGVIHDYRHGWMDGSIYGNFTDGAVVALSRLMRRYAVYVHTTRSPRQVAYWIEDRSGHVFECVTLSWWQRPTFWNQQGLLLVTNRKLPALAYIDDRAVKFTGDWDQALAEVGIS
jgi:hypothetical protein